MTTKTFDDKIRAALSAWVNQRAGLEPGNYGSWAGYRSESRRITRQRADFFYLLARCRPATESEWRDAFRAYSGRLTLTMDGDTPRLSYCTGQYWPTEYRAAACAVVSSLIWSQVRESCPDAETLARYGLSAGSWIRCRLAREFGARFASRWFDYDQRAASNMRHWRAWQERKAA